MAPRIPSADKTSRSLQIVHLHPLSPLLHTLPVPSSTHTHTPPHSPLRPFHPASLNPAHHLTTSYPYMATTSRHGSNHRHKTINTLLINHHRTQRVQIRSCTTSMGHIQSLKVQNRPIPSQALTFVQAADLDYKGNKMLMFIFAVRTSFSNASSQSEVADGLTLAIGSCG